MSRPVNRLTTKFKILLLVVCGLVTSGQLICTNYFHSLFFLDYSRQRSFVFGVASSMFSAVRYPLDGSRCGRWVWLIASQWRHHFVVVPSKGKEHNYHTHWCTMQVHVPILYVGWDIVTVKIYHQS